MDIFDDFLWTFKVSFRGQMVRQFVDTKKCVFSKVTFRGQYLTHFVDTKFCKFMARHFVDTKKNTFRGHKKYLFIIPTFRGH